MPAWYKGGLSPKILMNRRWSEPHLWISSLPFSFLTALQFRTKHFLCSGCIFPPILWFVREAPGVDWSEQNLWDLSATPGKDKATVTQRAINFCQHQAQTEEAPFFFFSKVDAAPKAVIPNIHLQTSVPTTLHACFLFLACFSLFVRSSVAPVRHFNELINVATLPHTGLDKSHFILEAAPVLLHSLILGWRLCESKGFCPGGFQGPL